MLEDHYFPLTLSKGLLLRKRTILKVYAQVYKMSSRDRWKDMKGFLKKRKRGET